MASGIDERASWSPANEEQVSAAERRVGTLVAGSYRIVRPIGSGGSSHVFEAEHVRLGQAFALKLLRPDFEPSQRTAQRFRREARAVARLRSEHVVNVFDCGELDDHTPYLVMELLRGEDLRALLQREGRLPVRRALRILLEACRGVAAAHAAELVHRDLKPENLFVTRRDTGEDWCKVLDFGVAQMDASISTAQGAIIGTVRYMAPEQLSNAAAVGPATDVYALGAILYECLAGQPLASGTTVQELMYAIMNGVPPTLSSLRPELPQALTELVDRCIAKSPDLRPPDAAHLAEALLGATRALGGTASDATLAEDAAPLVAVPAVDSRVVPLRQRLLLLVAVASAIVGGVTGWGIRRAPAAVTAATPSAPLASSRSVPTTASEIRASSAAPPASLLEPDATPAPSSAHAPAKSAPPAPRVAKPRRAPLAATASGNARSAASHFDATNPYE